MKPVLTTVLLMACADVVRSQDLLVTEFMAQRSIEVLDDDDTPSDFIELYNAGPNDVDLNG